MHFPTNGYLMLFSFYFCKDIVLWNYDQLDPLIDTKMVLYCKIMVTCLVHLFVGRRPLGPSRPVHNSLRYVVVLLQCRGYVVGLVESFTPKSGMEEVAFIGFGWFWMVLGYVCMIFGWFLDMFGWFQDIWYFRICFDVFQWFWMVLGYSFTFWTKPRCLFVG